MRKVILQMMTTLDGYYAGPNGEADWHNVDAEFNDYVYEFLSGIDTLLFGRVTYELMESFWPTPLAKENDPITADYMNKLNKIVFSRTLDAVHWENTRLVKENAADEISKLKQHPGKDIAILGSSDLTVSLMRAGLIDEYRIFVNPIVLGKGKSLFQGLEDSVKFELIDARPFRSGNVLLRYRTK